MQSFRSHLYIIFIAIFFVFGGEATSFASPPVSIYERNKNVILIKGFFVQGENVFSAGMSRPVSQSKMSRKACRNKAQLKAQAGFYRAVKDDIDWPSDMSLMLRDELFSEYISISDYTVHLSGLAKIDEIVTSDKCISVLYAKKNRIVSNKISYADLHNKITAHYNNDKKIDLIKLYLEVCEEGELQSALEDLSIAFGQIYGANVKAVMLGRNIESLPELWSNGRHFAYEEIVEFKLEQLMQLLGYAPYDPVLLYVIGTKFSDKGFVRLASLFYSRGVQWHIDPNYNRQCRESITDEFFVRKLSALSEKEIEFHKNSIGKDREGSLFAKGLARLVFFSYGTLPLNDSLNTQRISLPLADGNVDAFVNNNPNSNGFAAVAEHYTNQGKRELALPFAIQASRMNVKYAGLPLEILNR